jgi:hypothetical protein
MVYGMEGRVSIVPWDNMNLGTIIRVQGSGFRIQVGKDEL